MFEPFPVPCVSTVSYVHRQHNKQLLECLIVIKYHHPKKLHENFSGFNIPLIMVGLGDFPFYVPFWRDTGRGLLEHEQIYHDEATLLFFYEDCICFITLPKYLIKMNILCAIHSSTHLPWNK